MCRSLNIFVVGNEPSPDQKYMLNNPITHHAIAHKEQIGGSQDGIFIFFLLSLEGTSSKIK